MKARGRGLNHVNSKWFKLNDSNGDLVGDYLQKVGEFSVNATTVNPKCRLETWDSQQFKVIPPLSHRNNADFRKLRMKDQAVLVVNNDDSEDIDDPGNVCKFSGAYFIYLEYLVVNILIYKVK